MTTALPLLALFAGFILLVWSADRFVAGAASIARHLGVTPLVIGLTIVGFGTSAPEIVVSIIASLQDKPGLAIGNAIGSNITNLGLVLGVTALICPLTIRSETIRREYPILLAIMLGALLLLLDNHLGRLDGIILLSTLVLITVWLVFLSRPPSRTDPLIHEIEHKIPTLPFKQALGWTALGLILLIASSRILVYGATEIALWLGISDLVIGLTVIAIGTSLPELAASIISALRKEPDIAIGNVIGSNMFNLLAVLGLPGLISPMTVDPAVLTRDYPFMIGMTLAFFAFTYGFSGTPRLNWPEGGLILSGFIAYLVILYLGNR